MPSFRTRLSSICPSDVHAAKRPSNSTWSLDAVCAAYEATLKFLSTSYEQVVGSIELTLRAGPMSGVGKDAASASADSSTFSVESPIDAYRLITSAFVFIASPFSPYQLDFAKIERKHCGSISESVARSIHATVCERLIGPDLSSLQDAVDGLQRLGSSVFALAEGEVVRHIWGMLIAAIMRVHSSQPCLSSFVPSTSTNSLDVSLRSSQFWLQFQCCRCNC